MLTKSQVQLAVEIGQSLAQTEEASLVNGCLDPSSSESLQVALKEAGLSQEAYAIAENAACDRIESNFSMASTLEKLDTFGNDKAKLAEVWTSKDEENLQKFNKVKALVEMDLIQADIAALEKNK